MGNDMLKLLRSPGAEADLKACFNSYDKDKSGSLDKSELKAFAKDCYEIGIKLAEKMAKEFGVPADMLPPFDDKMVGDVLVKLDTDGDGKVSFEEFKKGLNAMTPPGLAAAVKMGA
eukprot:TRINITY_DN7819_c0_g2_i1.p1 TRINITY_DN7819_c0_g2~~TRINITY_DN7819_c0_g2_i1.p1  ORF type:complete len:116 (-),score=28.22 TRINITY_DN7819_c0_g2_i1:63-410(-)